MLLLLNAVHLPSSSILVGIRRDASARAWVVAFDLLLLMRAARLAMLLDSSALFRGAAFFAPLCCASSWIAANSLQENTPCAK
jgi:hypothetical protein